MGESSAGAGGACTNALLKVVHQEGTEMATQGKISYGTVNSRLIPSNRTVLAVPLLPPHPLPGPHAPSFFAGISWRLLLIVINLTAYRLSCLFLVQLLVKMKEVLKGRYTQIPQLSSGQKISTSEPWVLKSSNSRRNKALFIGINYVGTEHKLDGCHNDAIKMKKHAIDVWGFSSSNCKILMDDGRSTKPTRANIIAAMKWLVEGVRAGIVLPTPRSSLLVPVRVVFSLTLRLGIMALGMFLSCCIATTRMTQRMLTTASKTFSLSLSLCLCVFVIV
jgi:hypothetical protein